MVGLLLCSYSSVRITQTLGKMASDTTLHSTPGHSHARKYRRDRFRLPDCNVPGHRGLPSGCMVRQCLHEGAAPGEERNVEQEGTRLRPFQCCY